MNILKQVIKYDNANAIEATWADRIEVPMYESVYDENDPTIVVEEHQVGVEMRETVIRCHAYDGSQMQMFRDDVAQYGGNIAEYEALIAEVEAAYVPPPPAPPQEAVCSPWQIRKALNHLGLRQQVEDAISASADMTLKDGWEFATELRSDDPFVLAMGVALGKTEEETRELIAFASTL